VRAWPALLALLPLAVAGCAAGGTECDRLPDGRAVVESIDGRDAQVRLPDGGPLVLHLSAAVFVREGGDCTRTGPEGIAVGDTLAFHVDEVAESYPPQAWPEKAIVLR
jgi:hypothetical protein